MSKKLFFMLALSMMTGSFIRARDYYDCCPSYVDWKTPLHCRQIGLVVKGGVAPTIRTKREPVWLVNPCFNLSGPITGCDTTPLSPTSPVFTVSRTAKFQNQFKTPFTVGAELQYSIDGHHMIFLEYAYRQAKGRLFAFDAGIDQLEERTENFVSHAGYLGARHYFNRILCNHLSFFLGMKFGILHRKRVDYNLRAAVPSFGIPMTDLGDHTYFLADNAVSGGLQFGFDYNFSCNWSFQFNAEVVASAGPRVNQNIPFGVDAGETDAARLTALTGLTNAIVGLTGTEVQFPITFGIRYSFN